MEKRKVLLSLLFTTILLDCKHADNPQCIIDLSSLKLKAPVKVVLSGFKFNNNKWVNVKVDSIVATKNQVSWPQRYHDPFIASLTMYDSNNIILGFTDEFIFSNTDLNITSDKSKKPLNINGKYKDALSFKTEGGENNLFKNKSFLALPAFRKNYSLNLRKIKFTKYLGRQDKEFSNEWQSYEKRILLDVKKNHDCYYTLFKLMQIIYQISDGTLENCYNALDPNLRKTNEGTFIQNFLERSKTLYLGKKIITFNVRNRKNQEIVFNHQRETKYYFLDFWASWCHPCRIEMQGLKNIYNTVDTNKMQFISLSCDEQRDDWIIAAKAENLKWLDYIQPNNTNQSFLNIFSLEYIPQNILIDKRGIIINKNVSTSELTSIIKEKMLSYKN